MRIYTSLIKNLCLLGIGALYSTLAIGQGCPEPDFTVTVDCDEVVLEIDSVHSGFIYEWTIIPIPTGDEIKIIANGNITTFANPSPNQASRFSVLLKVSRLEGTTITCERESNSRTFQFVAVPTVSIADADVSVNGSSLDFTHCNRNYDLLRIRNTSSQISDGQFYVIRWGDGEDTAVNGGEFDTEVLVHQYENPGAYNVEVVMTAENGCIISETFPFLWGASPSIGLTIAAAPSQCAPATIPFTISGYQNNTPGTKYVITVSDGTVYNFTQETIPEIFEHTFNTTSCGFVTDNFEDAFSVRIDAKVEITDATGMVRQSCGSATATVEPIRINQPPTSGFEIEPDSIQCVEDIFDFVGTSEPGIFYEIDAQGCFEIIRGEWAIFPNNPNNYTITRGSLNDPEGFSAQFHKAGKYDIQLTTQHASFSPVCTIDTIVKSICVVPIPEAQSVLTQQGNGCVSTIFELQDTSNIWKSCDLTQTRNYWTIFPVESDCEAGIDPLIDTLEADRPIDRRFRFQSSGTFGIVLTTINQCGVDMDTTFVTVAKAPEVKIAPFVGGIICDETSIQFDIESFSACNFSDTVQYKWEFENASIDEFCSIGALPPSVNFIYDNNSPEKIQTRVIKLTTTSICGMAMDTIHIQIAPSPPQPIPSANQPCVGESLELCIDSDMTDLRFNWSKIDSDFTSTDACPIINNVTLADAGIYVLVVTDVESGCSSSASINVRINPLPPVAIVPNRAEVCIGDSFTFVATGAETYAWVDDEGTLDNLSGNTVIATPTTIRPHVYVAIGTDSLGCVNRDTAILIVHPLPVVEAGRDTAVCAGDPLLLDEATPRGGIWSGSGVDPSGRFRQDTAGIYTLYYEYTDENSCTNLDSLQVCVLARPKASFTVDRTIGCVGETGFIVNAVNTSPNLLDCRPANYQWDILFNNAECHNIETGGEVIFSDAVQPRFRFVESGLYTIRLRVSHDLCSDFNEFTQEILVGEEPKVAITSLPAICELEDGTAIQMPMATVMDCERGPSTYIWDFPGGMPNTSASLNPGKIIYNTTNGLVYPVQLTVTNECGTTVVRDTFRILELVSAAARIDTVGCAPFTLNPENLSEGSDLEYEWSVVYQGNTTHTSTEFEPEFGLTGTGWHQVNLTSFSPCDTVSWGDSIFISEAPNFTLVPTDTICVGDSINLDNYVNYFNRSFIDSVFWEVQDGTVANPTDFFPGFVRFNEGTTGSKLITLTAFNGCDTISNTLVVKINTPLIADFELPDFACLPIMLEPEDNSSGDDPFYSWRITDTLNNVLDTNFIVIEEQSTATPKITFKETGFYIVTLILSNGICPSDTHSDTIFISETPEFEISANFPDLYCQGDSINLSNPASPYLFFGNRELIDSIQWHIPGISDSLFTGFSRGTIAFEDFGAQTITVTAFNGCDTVSITDTLNILEPLIADFELDKKFVCQPDTVFINDLSRGGLRNYNWSITTIEGFEVDATDVRFDATFIPEPRLIVNRTGTYILCLTLVNGVCASSTHCDTIVVSELPRVDLVDFESPFCLGDSIPLNVSYGDTSLIDEIRWTVNGVSGIIEEVFFPEAILLDQAGQYTVIVNVSNNCGIVADTTIVTIFEPLQADFELETDLACTGDTICVIDRSIGDNRDYFYRVETLDGFPVQNNLFSTFVNADSIQKFVFNEPGDYVVTLELRNMTCPNSNIARDTINISELPDFSFSLSDSLICSGVDFDIQVFYNNLELIDSVIWEIEDIDTITTFNPGVINTTGVSGRKRISATAFNRCGATTIVQFIDIYEPITPSMELSASSICLNINSTLKAVSTSTGDSLNYLWSVAPSNTVVISTSMEQMTDITFSAPGTYTVTLTVFNDICGSRTIQQTLEVSDAPRIELDTIADFCQRATITPNISYPNRDSVEIDSIRWTFAGGIPETSEDFFPTAIEYDTPGEYVFCVTAFNSCTATTACDTFTIDTLPIISFGAMARDTFCASDAIDTLPTPQPDNGIWSGTGIIDGRLGTFSTGGLGSGTRSVTFTYTVVNGTCTTTADRTIDIFDLSFVSAGEDLGACTGSDRVPLTGGFPAGGQYTGLGVEEENGIFYFDPNRAAATYPIIYTYEQPFTGCIGTDTLDFTVHPLPTPVITDIDRLCMNVPETLGNGSIGGETYNWCISKNGIELFCDTSFTPTYTFPDTGTYVIQLNATSMFGCTSSTSDTVFVSAPPTALFSVIPNRACDSLRPTFFNRSIVYEDAIYTWCYLDTTYIGAELSDVVFPAGTTDTTYQIKLIVENNCGIDTFTTSVEVLTSPMPNFQVAQSSECSPATITFNNNTTGSPDSFVWEIRSDLRGFIASFTDIEPLAQVLTANSREKETYTITLTAINECGQRSISQTITVKPDRLNPLFTLDQSSGCEVLVVEPNNGTIFDPDVFYNWTVCDDIINNCFTSDEFDPSFELSAINNSITIYTITLFASNGCVTDSTFAEIRVFPKPRLSFEVVDSILCARDTLQFLNTSPDELSCVTYDFGDGVTSDLLSPTHFYSNAGTYTVQMIACDRLTGCRDTISREITINSTPEAIIAIQDTAACPPVSINIQNLSTDAEFFVYDFGDGNTSTSDATTLTHTYTQSGTFSVLLTASTLAGCTSQVTAGNISVYPIPTAGFSLPAQGDCYFADTICLVNESIDAVSYEWFLNGQLFSTATNPCIDFQETTTVTIGLISYNEFGCLNRTEQTQTIYIQPMANFLPLDTIVCKGDMVVFENLSTNYNFSNWYVNGVLVDSITNLNYVFSEAGTYSISLEVGNNIGCTDFLEMGGVVRVEEQPSVDFEYTFLENEPIFTYQFTSNVKGDILNYYWDFGDTIIREQNPIYRFPVGLTEYPITLIVEDLAGCTATVSRSISIGELVNLYIPNILEPENDLPERKTFTPKGIGLADYHIAIYSRNGQVVWESTALDERGSPTESWDGTYLGKGGELLPAGTYVWKVITAKFVDETNWKGMADKNDKLRKSGHVTLVR